MSRVNGARAPFGGLGCAAATSASAKSAYSRVSAQLKIRVEA